MDIDKTDRGFILQRALIRRGGPAEEHRHLMHHVEDVRSGRFVIMVLAPQRERRTTAADILDAHGAEFVAFYGRWAWEGITPRRGQAAAGPAADDHGADQPDDIPRLFVDAWNQRDPDALAALFDPDAEFVNVTGASAHNTDVVPNMETNVIGDDGAVRAANYRSGRVSCTRN